MIIVSTPVVMASAPVITEKDDGYSWVEQRSSHGHLYETLVFKVNNRLYRFADERIWTDGKDEKNWRDGKVSGHPYYLNDYAESTDYSWHDFHLSPDNQWLFVLRMFMHGPPVGVAYLFHFDRRHCVRVHPQGWRFDEAALRYFGRKLHFPVPALDSGGGRFIKFGYWLPHSRGLAFDLIESSYNQRQQDRRVKVITAQYSFRSKRFKSLKVHEE